MAYEKYNTDALVCGSLVRNTSDKTFLLFTADLGMVRVVAKSVREEKSRQRFALQDFSLIRVSLVLGKGGWQVAGANPLANRFMATGDRAARGFMHDATLFLRRFAAFEIPSRQIFTEIASICHWPDNPIIDYEAMRTVCIFRWLYHLGYIKKNRSHKAIIDAPSVQTAVVCLKPEVEDLIHKATAQAYQESHL